MPKVSKLTWAQMLEGLEQASEATAKSMLNAEISRMLEARPQWLLRIYGRYSKLRREREVRELLG